MNKTVILLFDVDATLIRTHGAGMRAMDRAFQEVMGWENIFTAISPAGMMDPAIAEALSQKYRNQPIATDEMDQVFGKYLIYLEEACAQSEEFEVLPGIKSFLENNYKQPNLLIGLGTGNLEPGAKIKLVQAKLEHYFSFGGFGTDGTTRAQMLAVAVKKAEQLLGTPVNQGHVIVIGDTHHDIEAGKVIGAKTIAVATGPFSMLDLAQHEPDLVLKDFSDHHPVHAMINDIHKSND